MTEHRRWLCASCQREWVYAHGWDADDGCPGCHASDISYVAYQPAFFGGDIPREAAPVPGAVIAAAETPAGLALIGSDDGWDFIS